MPETRTLPDPAEAVETLARREAPPVVIVRPRPLPDVHAGPASRAFADRVNRALDEACWYCSRHDRPCGACGRGL